MIQTRGEFINGDLNNLAGSPGIYNIRPQEGSIAHCPISTYGTLIQFPYADTRANAYIAQILISNENEVFMRHLVSSWGDWYRIDNFGCNTLSRLASALGDYIEVTEQTMTVTDFNDELEATGHFFKKAVGWTSSTLNRPSLESCDIAVLFGWNWVDAYGIQLILTKNNNRIFYRSRYGTNSWHDWVEMTHQSWLNSYNTLASLASAMGASTESLDSPVLNELEASYQNAAQYSLFQGCTASGAEGGWYGFKRTDALTSRVLISFSDRGFIVGTRIPNLGWSFTRLIQ